MKIITKDAAYVQFCDVFNFMDITRLMKLDCPKSISMRCFTNQIVVDGDNRYAFMEFKEKDAINFIKKLDCIIDYSFVATKTDEELYDLMKKLHEESRNLVEKYEKMNRSQQSKNYSKLYGEYHIKAYKAHSINDYLLYRKGEIKFDIPENLRLEEVKNDSPKEKTYVNTVVDIK